MAEKIKKITGMRLFMPIVCLFIVLLVNVIRTPDFFNITLKDGQLSGWLIDVINRGSELVILAIGMTLVTAASGGQDISVGAVMAVAAAVCCQILSGGEVSTNTLAAPIIIAAIAGILVAALCGAFNGFLVAKLNIQPMVATLILFTAGAVLPSWLHKDRLHMSVWNLTRQWVDFSDQFRHRLSLQSQPLLLPIWY